MTRPSVPLIAAAALLLAAVAASRSRTPIRREDILLLVWPLILAPVVYWILTVPAEEIARARVVAAGDAPPVGRFALPAVAAAFTAILAAVVWKLGLRTGSLPAGADHPLAWLAAGVAGVAAGVRAWRRETRVRDLIRQYASADLCPGCGYDLTGNESGVCPECGAAKGAP